MSLILQKRNPCSFLFALEVCLVSGLLKVVVDSKSPQSRLMMVDMVGHLYVNTKLKGGFKNRLGGV